MSAIPPSKKQKVDSSFRLPDGVWPTMITPFKKNQKTQQLSIDWPIVDRLVTWYIASGCSGIFTVCQSSEMFHLSNTERLELAEHVSSVVNKRAAVVACGTFDGSIEDQARFIQKMAKHVQAVVVITSMMAKKDDNDEVWKTNVKKLIALTPGVPLGLYECPQPYKRLLNPELLKWCAGTGRFFFHKDTCCQTTEIKAKVLAAASVPNCPFRFYNANVATLLVSLDFGGHGFSGISANFFPWIHKQLFDLQKKEIQAKNDKEKKEYRMKSSKIQRFLSVAENVVMYKYPWSAKKYLGQYENFAIFDYCRRPHPGFEEEEIIKLAALRDLMMDLCSELKITAYKP